MILCKWNWLVIGSILLYCFPVWLLDSSSFCDVCFFLLPRLLFLFCCSCPFFFAVVVLCQYVATTETSSGEINDNDQGVLKKGKIQQKNRWDQFDNIQRLFAPNTVGPQPTRHMFTRCRVGIIDALDTVLNLQQSM